MNMCRLLNVVAILHFTCVQGYSKISSSQFTTCSSSLYKVVKPWNICCDNCDNQVVTICPMKYLSLQNVTNQRPRWEDLSQLIYSHLNKNFPCCNSCIDVYSSLPRKCSIFRTKPSICRMFFIHFIRHLLPDIRTFYETQLSCLTHERTKLELSFDWGELKGFESYHFLFFIGREIPRYLTCHHCRSFDIGIFLILTSISLCAFRPRFTLCFFSVSLLFVGTCWSLPESPYASSAFPADSEPPNETSRAAFKKADSLPYVAESIRSSTKDKTRKLSDTSDSRMGDKTETLFRNVSDSQINKGSFAEPVESQENNSRFSDIPSRTNTNNRKESTVFFAEPANPQENNKFYETNEGLEPTDTEQTWSRPRKGRRLTKRSSRRSNSTAAEGLSARTPPVARSCSLHLVADYLFFSQVGRGSVITTVNIMKDVIHGADAIFRSTDFDQDGVGDNLGFLIQNITVLQTYPSRYFSYTEDSSDHMQYLRNFSTADHSQYCLAIAFTNLRFRRGVWGVAWTASSSDRTSPGGICQRRVFLPRYSHAFSFNTAAMTFSSDDGHRLSMEAAVRVLTHELGHCFGSSHDDESKLTALCGFNTSGTDTYGDYMMNQYATSGSLPNNYRFSPCSVRLMYPVIVHKGTCLQDHQTSRCGNGLVEDGEECDCGNSHICEYNDPCCTPSDASNHSTDAPCTVRRSEGKVCSPLSGSCCLSDCQVTHNASGVVCNEATECHEQSLCDGQSGKCPRPVIKPNGTLCGGGSRLCVDGWCVGSVCSNYGLQSCRCTGPPVDKCALCCRTPTVDSDCQPAQQYGIVDEQGQPIHLLPGEHCSDVSPAFCDRKHVCVPHFKISRVTYFENSSRLWAIQYWPYLLFFLLLVVFGIIFKLSVFSRDDAHIRSCQYGKLVGIFRIAGNVGVHDTQDIAVTKYLFDRFLKKAAKRKQQMHTVEAVSRLRTFFPTCPLSYIIAAVDMATDEDVAVRVLLVQGFPIRSFMPMLSQSEFAHLAHLLPRTLFDSGCSSFLPRKSEKGHLKAKDSSARIPGSHLESDESSSSSDTDYNYDWLKTKTVPLSGVDNHHLSLQTKTGPKSSCDQYLQHSSSELIQSRQLLMEVLGERGSKDITVHGNSKLYKHRPVPLPRNKLSTLHFYQTDESLQQSVSSPVIRDTVHGSGSSDIPLSQNVKTQTPLEKQGTYIVGKQTVMKGKVRDGKTEGMGKRKRKSKLLSSLQKIARNTSVYLPHFGRRTKIIQHVFEVKRQTDPSSLDPELVKEWESSVWTGPTTTSAEQQSTTRPGVDHQTTASSSVDQQTSTSPGVDQQTSTSPGVDQQTSTSPGVDQQTTTSPRPSTSQQVNMVPKLHSSESRGSDLPPVNELKHGKSKTSIRSLTGLSPSSSYTDILTATRILYRKPKD